MNNGKITYFTYKNMMHQSKCNTFPTSKKLNEYDNGS